MQDLMIAGMTVSWSDYHIIPALVWDDLKTWKLAEIARSNKENEK